jgi:CBS domain containing-hemolysin-like protein
LLDGGLAVRDLNRRLKLSLPESETYTTIAGFLMTEAGHILQPGDVVKHDGLIFHIERVERRRVLRVRLEKTEEPEKEAAESGEAKVTTDKS